MRRLRFTRENKPKSGHLRAAIWLTLALLPLFIVFVLFFWGIVFRARLGTGRRTGSCHRRFRIWQQRRASRYGFH